MAQITFDNRLGHRSLKHLNLLVGEVAGQQVIFEFPGANIPGVATITDQSYEKNGKWSYSAWTVELAPNIQGFVWTQDWELGTYVTAGTWNGAIAQIQGLCPNIPLQPAAIERFVRARLPAAAKNLDAANANLLADTSAALQELLSAQEALANAQRDHQELVAEVTALEAAEQARKDAEALRIRTSAAREAMKHGASLADLKALLA